MDHLPSFWESRMSYSSQKYNSRISYLLFYSLYQISYLVLSGHQTQLIY